MQTDASRFINEMESNGTVIIRSFTSIPKLAAEISAAIADGRAVAFVPGQRSLRHFFNPQGFISTTNEMVAQIEGAAVILPPGVYEGQCLFALRPQIPADVIVDSNR